jgi:adenine deaminase
MEYMNKHLVRVALGQEPADLIIRGGKLIDVYTRRVSRADVAIADGRIAAVGDVSYCAGKKTAFVDAAGKFLAPGLIDAHIHPDVSKLTITRMANALVPRGVTSIMCPLDQVGVVAGIEGMRFVLDEAAQTPLKLWHSSPSRLPYTTPASTIGHRFGPPEHAVAQKWPEAVGIWEYMSDSIVDFDEPVYQVAEMAMRNRLSLNGHAPLTMGRTLSACAAAGMRNDHESYTAEEVAEKMANGVWCLIRRGTHSDNVPECVRAITELGLDTRHMALCTDDSDCMDISEQGGVDFVARYVIRLGVDPISVIQMGSLNAAECYKVDMLVGSITPGRIADILLLGDLPSLRVDAVVANGRLVARDGKILRPAPSPQYPPSFHNTMKLDRPMKADDLYLRVDPKAEYAEVLCVHVDLDEGLLSRRRDAKVAVRNGKVQPDPDQDVLYISVTDRYTGKGMTGLGMISGFGLKRGAIATSLSPDDCNIICVGASVDDMAVAINHLVQLGGGQVVVDGGNVTADLPLPLCGILADVSVEEMAAMERNVNAAVYDLGTRLRRPFFFLIFLSITAIPEYAMTDQGLVAHASRSVINPIQNVILAKGR